MNGDIDKNESAVKEKKGAGGVQIGVRYISEDLIRKLTKQEHLGHITSLNLTLAKNNGKKIKYIENLESLKKLQTLNLSCNMIEKIEKLEKLTQLRELNVSFNSLTKIESLQTLTNIQMLNLNGNQIEHIPNWLPKKLKALRTFRIAKNNIQSLQELSKLRPLRDLTQLAVAENPVTQLPHCRAFLIFHLRTVNVLDGQKVTEDERNAAHSRFALEELESLTEQLHQQESAYQELEETHNKSLQELQTCDRHAHDTHQRLKDSANKIAELELELATKNDLLKKKTSQLTAACQKHYELEQEVAFYKIDHKFDSLARPKPPSPDSGDGVDDGLIGGESPYFGKGRFQQNMYARESVVSSNGHAVPLTYGNMKGARTAPIATAELEAMHAALDKELAEKRCAIEQAQEHLRHLQQELAQTQDNIADATEELQKMSMALTEDDKQALRNRLTKKISMVHQLKAEADRTEAEMQRTEDEIVTHEKGIGNLRGRLRRMGSKDSLYNEVKREVADRETQLDMSTQQYQALQSKLEHMLATIARETIEIKKLEQELREAQVVQNEEMKLELESIIGGLQSYLTTVRQKSEGQRDEYAELVRDHEDLLEQLRDTRKQKAAADAQAAEASLLRERLAEAEVSLDGERQENVSLRQQVNESQLREGEEEEMLGRLKEAVAEMERLKAALIETANRSQCERENYERELQDQDQQLRQAKERARLANAREDEIHNLHRTLADIQRANAKLQDQVYGLQQKLKDQTDQTVNPEDLRQRLGAFTRALCTGQTGELGIQVGEEDPLGEALVELQGEVQRELNKSVREVERAHTERDNAEAAVHAMQDKFTESRTQERLMAEGVIQALIEEERKETRRMKAQIDRLRSQLQRERMATQERSIPVHLLQPSKTTSSGSAMSMSTVTSATTGSTDDTSTVLSSQWSEKRHQMYQMMTPDEQDLFDELQREIEELRKLLGGKNKNAADKITQAERTAEKLLDMIASRRASEKTQSSMATGMGRVSAARSSAHHGRDGDPRLRQAAKDLARAQEHIEFLQSTLRDHNHAVIEGREQSRHAVAARDEIDKLYDVLEEQRSEILHLNDVVGDLATQLPDDPHATDDQLAALERDNAAMRDHLMQQQPHFQSVLGQQVAPQFDGYFNSAAYHQNERVPPYLEQPMAPSSSIPGRPVPTFYGEGGQVLAPPPIDQQYGIDVADGGQGVFDHPGYEQVMPQGPAAVGTQYGFPCDGGQGSNIQGGIPQSSGVPFQQNQQQPFQQNQQPLLQNQQLFPQNQQPFQQNQQPLLQNQQLFPQNQQPFQQIQQPATYAVAPGGFVQPSASGQFPGQVLQQGNVPQGGGVTFMSPVAPGSQFLVSTPTTTTPIAGPGQVFMQSTPDGRTTQPVMFSTPISPATEVGRSSRPVKGILKKSRSERERQYETEEELEEGLVCNVPEHHDLEDYTHKLQETIRALKSQLGQYGETSASSSEDSQHVLFVDDLERRALKKLKVELKDRRAELEALDLAVGRQKSQLVHMREVERNLLGKREDAARELKELRRNNKTTRPQRRRQFLDGTTIYDVDESDYVYDYDPRSHRPRRDLLCDEIKCLESTLAKRRAELREADRLLLECEADLINARKEATLTLRQFEDARSSLTSAMTDSEEIERRSHEAGVNLVRAEEQLRLMQRKNEDLTTRREENKKMLQEIEMVITRKDDEFQHVDVKLRSASQRLLEVEASLTRVDGEMREKLSLAQESDDLMSTRRRELTSLTQQITTSHKELEQLTRETGRTKTELQLLQETTEKRRQQLDSLDTQLEQEIASRRLEIKVVEDKLTDLQAKRRIREQDINWTQHDESEMDGLSSEVRQRTTELEQLKLEVEQARAELLELGVERTTAEAGMAKFKREKAQLDDIQHSLNSKIHELKRAEQQIGERVKNRRLKLEHLDAELRHIESALDEGRDRKGLVDRELSTVRASVHEHTGELGELHTSLREAESQVELLEQMLKTVKSRFSQVSRDLATKENELRSATESLERVKVACLS
ncbi:Centriolin [Lamellibrachia satsuma]|nr:Centriolin [Lamellibrachia satsuma]